MHPFDAARHIVRTLHAAGHVALLAGGCVRDRLLGLEPKDYDVATSAPPETVMTLFPRTHPVGLQFGVVIVLVDDASVEVATFRSDGDYRDGRRPETVRYSSPEEDASRRDFTINALFLDPESGAVFDHVGGRADLAARRLRTVGDAAARFAEDRLRMLRAVRFAARFALTVDPAIPPAVRAHAAAVHAVARERITEELVRIADGPHPDRALELLEAYGLREQILPAVDAGRARCELLRRLPDARSSALGIAAWLHGVAPEGRGRTLDSLRLSRAHREAIEALLDASHDVARFRRLDVATQKRLARRSDFTEALGLAAAAGGEDPDAADAVAAARTAAASWSDADLRPARYLDGDDLKRLGVPVGPKIGRCLRELEDEALRGGITSAADARQWVTNWLGDR